MTMDGFGTNSALQRGQMAVHLEHVNPWLPTVRFGMDGEMAVSIYRQGSGNFGAQAEYDLLSENGLKTAATTLSSPWVGIISTSAPAERRRWSAWRSFGEGDDGRSSNTDRKDFSVYGRIEPFTKMKNKWIEGLGFEAITGGGVTKTHAWYPPSTFDPAGTGTSGNQSACRRLQIQDHGDGGRQTLFQFTPSGSTPRVPQKWIGLGAGWKVVRYALRLWIEANQ